MKITIELTVEELNETGLGKAGLVEHVIECLDSYEPTLPGYNVEVIVNDS